ncbi:MAG: Gfo/Idh/MocA family oxidoreductase [Candidatus Diapherotrites archaeon]
MKVAVIGAGRWGKNHIREYLSLGQEVTVCDLNAEILEQRRKEFPNISTEASLEKILVDDSIRALSICTPNETHVSIAEKFLNAGKNILLEKPMALNSKDAKKLAELAKQKKSVFTVGHVFRYNNALIEAKKWLDEGKLGEVYIAKLTWTNLDPIYENWDILTDLGLHPVDILHYLFGGKPRGLQYAGECYRKKQGEEAGFVSGKIGKKTLFEIEMSWLTPKKVRTVFLVGEKQSLYIDALAQTVEVLEKVGEEKKLSLEPSNALNWELKAFLDSVESGKPLRVTPEIGVQVTEILEEAKHSLESWKEKK